jgi:hypothetical protein
MIRKLTMLKFLEMLRTYLKMRLVRHCGVTIRSSVLIYPMKTALLQRNAPCTDKRFTILRSVLVAHGAK